MERPTDELDKRKESTTPETELPDTDSRGVQPKGRALVRRVASRRPTVQSVQKLRLSVSQPTVTYDTKGYRAFEAPKLLLGKPAQLVDRMEEGLRSRR